MHTLLGSICKDASRSYRDLNVIQSPQAYPAIAACTTSYLEAQMTPCDIVNASVPRGISTGLPPNPSSFRVNASWNNSCRKGIDPMQKKTCQSLMCCPRLGKRIPRHLPCISVRTNSAEMSTSQISNTSTHLSWCWWQIVSSVDRCEMHSHVNSYLHFNNDCSTGCCLLTVTVVMGVERNIVYLYSNGDSNIRCCKPHGIACKCRYFNDGRSTMCYKHLYFIFLWWF